MTNVEDERYHRLMEATRELAQQGYDAVQMRELASIARMSLQTIYQFCSSKDHLIAEAHVDWLDSFRSQLATKQPLGDTAADRVSDVLRRVARTLDADEQLSSTILRALFSPEPAVHRSLRQVSATYGSIIDLAIGDEDVPDRATVIEVIGHVINSAMSAWVTRSITAEEVGDLLERTARLLLRR